jgi:hypothetical protein
MVPARTLEVTPEVVKEDGVNRVVRTGAQVTVAASILTVGEWIVQQAGWDGNIPTRVRDAMVVVLALVVAYVMNRAKVKATDLGLEGHSRARRGASRAGVLAGVTAPPVVNVTNVYDRPARRPPFAPPGSET